MTYLKLALCLFTILFVSYRIGLLWKKKNSVLGSHLLYGFVMSCALFEVINVPFIFLKLPISTIFIINIIVFFLLISYSFYKEGIKHEILFIKNLKNIKQKKSLIPLIIVTLILIFGQAVASTYLFNENADDAFYVSLVHDNIENDHVYSVDPSTGNSENTTALNNYKFSAHELALSTLCYGFQVSPPILCHTLIPFVMILMVYLLYYTIARKFFDEKHSLIFLILIGTIFLFGGTSSRMRGLTLLSRMWQGKMLFSCIFLPFFYKAYIEKDYKLMFVINLASIFSTPTAIMLLPFLYICLGIIQLIQKNWKNFWSLVISSSPILVFGILYLLQLKMTEQGISQVNQVDYSYEFFKYFGDLRYVILYGICVLFILIKKEETKKVLGWVPIILMVTICNPLFANIVCKYITGIEVYWRIWWLFPVELTITYVMTKCIYNQSQNIKKIVTTSLLIIVIILCGTFVYTRPNEFEIPENLEKINSFIIHHTHYILEHDDREKITVMAYPEPYHGSNMRQLNNRIHLFWSRDNYMKNLWEDDYERALQFYQFYHDGYDLTYLINQFNENLDYFEIDWVIYEEEKSDVIAYLDKTDLVYQTTIDGYRLYRHMKS